MCSNHGGVSSLWRKGGIFQKRGVILPILHEGALTFAARGAVLLPKSADDTHAISRLYMGLRYGDLAADGAQQKLACALSAGARWLTISCSCFKRP